MESWNPNILDTNRPDLDEPLSPGVREIIGHLCEGANPTFGDVLEWCESRGDCCSAVVCPHCGGQFVIDEDELAELQRWTREMGEAMACGIRFN
jgi:hypothetical protein